ncbi:MAG: hypothetical protein AB1633_00195 [Elusimicrobiota bacterium]
MILGVEAPKLVNGATTVLLDYAVMDPDFGVEDVIEKVSVFNGYREYILFGDYAEFKLEIYLFEYGDTLARKNKFLEIYNQRKNLVDFYPHRDGGPIKNEAGEIVKFAAKVMKPFYFQNEPSHDAMYLYLKSQKYIDITKSLV